MTRKSFWKGALFLSVYSATQGIAAPPSQCPPITRSEMTQVCVGNQPIINSSQGPFELYRVSCAGLGMGKELSLKTNSEGANKLYYGQPIQVDTQSYVGREGLVCGYPFHVGGLLRISKTAQIGVMNKPVFSPMHHSPDSSENSEMQPFLPYDSLSSLLNTNQVTPLALKILDRSFIEQTGGTHQEDGIKRAIGTGLLLLLVNHQYVKGVPIQQLNKEERETLAQSLLVTYLGGAHTSLGQSYLQTGSLPIDTIVKLYEDMKSSLLEEYRWKMMPQTWMNREQPLDRQFQEEVKIFFRTLFPDKQHASRIRLSQQDNFLEFKKQNFLKRLFIALAWTGYSPIQNASKDQLIEWPFTLASILGRGGRVALVGENQDIRSVFQYLMDGNTQPNLPIYFKRPLASHGVAIKQGRVVEIKLSGIGGGVQNLFTGLKGSHLGVNIALGGLGSPQVDGALVGPGGISIDPQTGNPLPKRQHGHVYLNLTPEVNSILIGLEGNAPQTQNMFGDSHDVSSASSYSGDLTSVAGGQKWAQIGDMGYSVPHNYGGKWVYFSPLLFDKWTRISEFVLGQHVNRQEEIFKQILGMTPSNARAYLESLLGQ